jgi:hypothetical protein
LKPLKTSIVKGNRFTSRIFYISPGFTGPPDGDNRPAVPFWNTAGEGLILVFTEGRPAQAQRGNSRANARK